MALTEYQRRRYEEAKKVYTVFIKLYPFTLEDLDGEQWTDIPNYEGLYQVSTFGRVKSFQYKKPRIIRPSLSPNGYLAVCLSKNGKSKTKPVHSLVARVFVLNIDNLPQIDHRYGMKFDNCADNLRWVTAKANSTYALELGLKKSGANSARAKLTDEEVVYIRDNVSGLNQTQLAAMFDVTQATISSIQLGQKYKDAGGMIHQKRQGGGARVVEGIRDRIRSEYVFGSSEFGSLALARKYGVDHKTVLKIVHEK